MTSLVIKTVIAGIKPCAMLNRPRVAVKKACVDHTRRNTRGRLVKASKTCLSLKPSSGLCWSLLEMNLYGPYMPVCLSLVCLSCLTACPRAHHEHDKHTQGSVLTNSLIMQRPYRRRNT